MSGRPGRAIVIGGGVIGTACAYYLARKGWRVTILEQGRFASGSSHANCGLVCPSHILPLAEPGAIREALGGLLRANAPFAIRPRVDFALWSWLAGFARRCNRHDMIAAGHAIQPLLEQSLSLYKGLVASESVACEWETRGVLFVYRSPDRLDSYAKIDELLREEFACPARRIEGAELGTLEPALRDGLAGGWYYERDAHLRPDCLMDSWRRVCESYGVEVVEGCKLSGFEGGDGLARAASSPAGPMEADAFVVATGAWTPQCNDQLGCCVPIEPGKGYSITMPRPTPCPAIPMIFPETHVAVTPFASGYRLGSTMEFAGYDDTLDSRRLSLLSDGARDYLRQPTCEPIEETWYGWRPMTPDSVPIIDRAPRYRNVLVAAGHNMLGLSMAPATGRLVAELLSDEAPSIDPRPYRISRFA
jgi:D-amino-acid dehydrogenase